MKTLEQCQKEYGADLGTVEIAGVTFVFGNPTREAWRKLQSARTALKASEGVEQASIYAGRAEVALEAMEELARTACCSHDPKELEAAADVYYDTMVELGEAVRERFAAKQEALGKASARPGAEP